MGTVVKTDAGVEKVGASIVILADVSGSMDERAAHGRKIDRLREALGNIWAETPGAALIAFNNDVVPVEGPDDLPPPCGGTALHLALRSARVLHPASVIVISDGRPSDREAALEAARDIPGTIDAIYIGPDSDTEAIRFMRELCRIGAGAAVVTDLSRVRSLVPSLRGMLGLPAK